MDENSPERQSQTEEQQPLTEPAAALQQRPATGLVFGEHGLRAGWRILLYIVLFLVLSSLFTLAIALLKRSTTRLDSPAMTLLGEVISFGSAFGSAILMSKIEKRRVGLYGLPGREFFGGKFWLGFLFGLLEISLLIGAITALGGYSFGPLALHGNEIIRWGLFHLVLFIFVGLFEEFLFRGYLQYTLADGIGFWPAALVLSLGFGAVHLFNPGEGPIGAASVALFGLSCCFMLQRTGSLWYAVGLHSSFDWGETFLFSVPNSGTVMQGHLSNSLLHGPKWLTGGSIGPEGTLFCFITIALQVVIVALLFPRKPSTAETTALEPADPLQ